jgi:hypothetical protein
MVTGLTINSGAAETIERQISLQTTATDTARSDGPASVLYAELLWNSTANRWIVKQWSEWLPYGQTHTWTLTETPGLRYLQAFVSDQAGNISGAPAKAMINYVQSQDSVQANESRVYRRWVQAGQCLEITITPQLGDPDLYVWPPNYSPGNAFWYSINGGVTQDRVQVNAPTTGYYQIEIEGFTNASYTFAVDVSNACTATATSSVADKTVRTEPIVNVNASPSGIGGEQPPTIPPTSPNSIELFLPSIRR